VNDRPSLLTAAARVSALSSGLAVGISTAALILASESGSLALVAFGLESIVDAGASGVLVWRFRVEGRKPDRGAHVEQRARRVIGFVLISVAVYLLTASIRSLVIGSHPHESTGSVTLAAASVVILPAVAYRKLALARGLGSRSLRADGLLTAGGAVLAAITLAAILLARYERVAAVDPAAALVVAVVLLREAISAFREPN
jgi:divalent metal cation (Fe/Co/Zn/Cd) transporter